MIRRWFFIAKDAMPFCDHSKVEPKFLKIIIAFFFHSMNHGKARINEALDRKITHDLKNYSWFHFMGNQIFCHVYLGIPGDRCLCLLIGSVVYILCAVKEQEQRQRPCRTWVKSDITGSSMGKGLGGVPIKSQEN